MTWDYIVVGAGSAGCALASELVRAGRRVLVIEAGGNDRSPFIRVASGQLRACQKHDWGYWSEPDPSRNGARENWIRGRVLGGSSSLNGTMYVRGTPYDFDNWRVPGWSAADVMPVFRQFEHSDQHSPVRGQAGPLRVRTVKRPHPVTTAFLESARAAGHAINPDYNGETQEGVGLAQLSQRGGFRCSSADAFLKPLLGKPNLELLLDALVEKILVENGRAVGVALSQGGVRRQELASEVIVCAGAINTPKLLMLSGIGDPVELKRHDIPLVHALPHVGLHLQDHPLVTLNYRSKIPTYNLTEGIGQKLGIALRFLGHGEGPISNLFEGVAFLKSDPSQPVPDLQIIFMAMGYGKDDRGQFRLSPFPSFMVHVLKSYPLSSGRVRLASSDSASHPLIECRLLQEQADVDTLSNGIRTLRSIMAREPIASLIDREIDPGSGVTTQTSLEEFVRSHTSISFHACGTCRMGTGDDSVVTQELRIRGIGNLWIADASVIPRFLSANINAACIMIGIRLGQHLIKGGLLNRGKSE